MSGVLCPRTLFPPRLLVLPVTLFNGGKCLSFMAESLKRFGSSMQAITVLNYESVPR